MRSLVVTLAVVALLCGVSAFARPAIVVAAPAIEVSTSSPPVEARYRVAEREPPPPPAPPPSHASWAGRVRRHAERLCAMVFSPECFQGPTNCTMKCTCRRY